VDRFSAGEGFHVAQEKQASAPPPSAPPKQEKDFFAAVDEQTRRELAREKRREMLSLRAAQPVAPEPQQPEREQQAELRVSSSESGIDKGRAHSPASSDRSTPDSAAKERIAELEGLLQQEKAKTKRLLQLFKDADLKEKAHLVIEAERANKVADELTAQVAELNTKLEQERSKVHSLTDELKKLQVSPKSHIQV
jgi:uncharacterized coiled-coil protein SlyX